MTELTLEQQVQRLTDIEAIKQMKSQYCYYADHGYDPDGMVSLFVEDAIWDGGDFGRYEGVDEIREFFVGIKDEIVFAIHPVMNPIITIDGDTANARWWLIMWCTMMVDGEEAGPMVRRRVRRRPGEARRQVALHPHQGGRQVPGRPRGRLGRADRVERVRLRRAGYRLPPNPALRSSRSRTPPMPSCAGPKNAPVTVPSSPPACTKVLPRTSIP